MQDPNRPARVHLVGWRHPAVVAVGLLSMASGFAQFSATAALGDVARAFGQVTEGGTSLTARIGLSGTTLGVGTALIRLASLGALPLAGLADRRGRRSVLLWCSAAGLALVATASLSPSFWVLVLLLAMGRPLLSAVNAVAGVVAAEETSTADRSAAIALVTVGYGTGAGLTAIVRGRLDLGFRPLFALALVPLVLLPLVARMLEEPERFEAVKATARTALGHVPVDLRGRLWLVSCLTFAIAFVTGPVNTYLFLYAENVLGMSPATLALAVIAAGFVGLPGLLVGRWAADRFGRRWTAGLGHSLVALLGIVTYLGTPWLAVGGYLLSIFVASAYAPAGGALGTELFPTSARATAAGWQTVAGVLGAVAGLLVFGLLADALGGFNVTAVIVGLPVALASLLFARLPETRGLELEESAPE